MPLVVGSGGLGCSGLIGGPDTAADAGTSPDPESTSIPAAGAQTLAEQCQDVVEEPSPVIVARLTRTEYLRTIQDVFGVDVSAEASGLPFEIRAPQTTTAVAQSTDIQHIEVFSAVSARVAEAWGDFAPQYTDCTEFAAACERSLVERLGAKVFQRPLRPDEVSRFLPIFRVVESESDSFQTAATLVLRAMLQSPQFLYHLEDHRGSGVRPLSQHELARRLAYLVWQSAPDEALLLAAERGELATSAQIEAQVRRLAADSRARSASLAFFEDWIDLTRLERAVRGLDDEVKVQMREETERLVEDVLWGQQGGLQDLLGAQHTFATPALATRYGFESAGPGWQRYDLTSVSARRGILTQGSLLAAHANGNRPAFVSRGLFILRSILCRDVPDPPAGVDTNITDLPETASERAKSAERLGRGSCGPCHAVFDPLAYAFEGYDGFGQLSDVDVHGNPVRSDGWVPAKFGGAVGTPEGEDFPYDDVDGLIEVLVSAPFVRSCLAEKPLGFALRRQIDDVLNDDCAVESIATRTEQLGGSYTDLLVAIGTHRFFTQIPATGGER